MTEVRSRPSAVGVKFEADGSVRPFAGNTIICHVDPKSALMDLLIRARDGFRPLERSGKLALLPPSSYHMTVFEGVCDEIRTPARWPADIPATASLHAVTSHFGRILSGFRHGMASPTRLRATEPLKKWGAGVLALEPSSPDENRQLRNLRDRLSEALQLRTPDHDAYVFHITLAYVLDWPDAADERIMGEVYDQLQAGVNALGPIEFAAPEFCTFQDMFAFRRQFHLAA